MPTPAIFVTTDATANITEPPALQCLCEAPRIIATHWLRPIEGEALRYAEVLSLANGWRALDGTGESM